MKVRAGFVSNSSSSSFVVYGVELSESILKKIEDKLDEKHDLYDELYNLESSLKLKDVVFYSDTDFENDLIGISIADIHSDGDATKAKKSLVELDKQADKLIEKLKEKYDIEINKDDFQIYAGTRSC